ncbi:MATE family efflux transporter [Actinokineospora globicatena]|uniref:MATE family efflux transporter n=1 Tax=Actinokineospora globicatena TaxID=103729 RepID=UPI0020A2FD1F|nr:MATE family efflux transporter [Actinokineospora globicatena]MCP2303100.1 putative efflux protein, MATE family [Actinokineospora globicatena]GLW79786.1 MATE family efflux transporter [Actinokineospora globicatena]GLW85804.1 MATE family efflux transporter [Actinokineospora globicatena]
MGADATDMTTGPPLRKVLGFALPLTAANLLQQGYLLVDGVVVGHWTGVDGLAAIGAAGPLFYLLNAMFIGLGTAFTIRLAHLRGAGDADARRGVVLSLALVTVVWSVGCVLVATALVDPALAVMGLRGQLAHDASVFLSTLSLGFPGIFGTAAVSAYLRGLGDSRTALWVAGFGSIANAALVLLLVAVWDLGIAGAALATAISSTAALVVGLVVAARKYPVARTGERPAVRREFVDAVRLGFPLASQHIILALGIMVLVWILQAFGPVVLAAFSIVARVEQVTAMLFLDFSGAITAFTAQNLGADDQPRARTGLVRTLGLTAVLTVIASAVVLVARGPIAALFTDDPATRALTERYLLIIYPFLALYTLMVVLHGYLNGSRRTTAPLICTVIAFLLVQIPFAYLFHGAFGVEAVMWAVVAGWTAGLTYSVLCLRRVLFVPQVHREVVPT